jgi:hypothetical protein
MFVFDGEKTTEFILWDYFLVGIGNLFIDHNDYVWCSKPTFSLLYRYGVWLGNDHCEIIDFSKFDEYIATIREAPDYKMWFGTGNGIVISDKDQLTIDIE